MEGNTPSVASPANISLFVVLLGPPHPQPWECPPCSHDPPRYPKGLFPFPTALPGKQGTTGRAGQGRRGPGTHTCRELGAVERGKSNKRPGWKHSSIPNTRMLDGPAAASSTPAQFPTDKGGQARPGRHPSENTRGRHPSGSEPRIPQEAKGASLGKHRAPLRGSPRAGLTHGHHPHPKLGGFPPPATPIP